MGLRLAAILRGQSLLLALRFPSFQPKETNYPSQMAAQSSEMLGSNFAALLEVRRLGFQASKDALGSSCLYFLSVFGLFSL